MINRKERELVMMLAKIRAMMTRPIPERGAAIAAIDYYLMQCRLYAVEGERPLNPNDIHMTDAGMDSRTAEMIESALDVWSLGELATLTRQQILNAPYLSEGTLAKVEEVLSEHGLKLATVPVCVSALSPEEASEGEATVLDQLLDEWLGLQVVRV